MGGIGGGVPLDSHDVMQVKKSTSNCSIQLVVRNIPRCAECMEYLPRLGETWPHEQGEMYIYYSLHGATGIYNWVIWEFLTEKNPKNGGLCIFVTSWVRDITTPTNH